MNQIAMRVLDERGIQVCYLQKIDENSRLVSLRELITIKDPYDFIFKNVIISTKQEYCLGVGCCKQIKKY